MLTAPQFVVVPVLGLVVGAIFWALMRCRDRE